MTNLRLTTLIALTACATLAGGVAQADHSRYGSSSTDLLIDLATAYVAVDSFDRHTRDRASNRAANHGYDRDYRRGFRQPNLEYGPGRSGERDFAARSYTSDPIRGGSSRRTRIVENPFPNRPLRGISFTGIEHDPVHINDVITYPRKRLISRQGYSLSLYHPSRFLNARGYVDYISVKAKRREHFTVTFHYD